MVGMRKFKSVCLKNPYTTLQYRKNVYKKKIYENLWHNFIDTVIFSEDFIERNLELFEVKTEFEHEKIYKAKRYGYSNYEPIKYNVYEKRFEVIGSIISLYEDDFENIEEIIF